MQPMARLEEILEVMNRSGVKMMVNLTGGYGNCLRGGYHDGARERNSHE